MVNLNQQKLHECGLKAMREFYKEYQEKKKGSDAVRIFLEKAFEDEALLLRYLIGRKYRAKHAWETIRTYAEMRYNRYPEMFPATLPPKEILFNAENQPVCGFLKGRDSKGRRIAYFQISAWDVDKCTLEEIKILSMPIVERALLDEDCLNNGVIFVHECSGMGFAHAKQYTVASLLKFLNIYWFAFPVKLKGVYFVNLPSFLTFIYKMVKPFMPTKFKERFLVTTTSQGFTDLHERLPIDVLPKCLGGNLESSEAVDYKFFG